MKSHTRPKLTRKNFNPRRGTIPSEKINFPLKSNNFNPRSPKLATKVSLGYDYMVTLPLLLVKIFFQSSADDIRLLAVLSDHLGLEFTV